MSDEYNNYIREHTEAVWNAFEWLSENILLKWPDFMTNCGDKIGTIGYLTRYQHDASKYSEEEYDAYDAYFYGGNKSHKVMEDFDYAWLHHIHNNPHHWQYWVLINDDEKDGTKALEMPVEYVIEMICDWWSFSWRSGNLYEIFNWYDEHKDRIIMHEKTRKLVEEILDKIRVKLDEDNGENNQETETKED